MELVVMERMIEVQMTTLVRIVQLQRAIRAFKREQENLETNDDRFGRFQNRYGPEKGQVSASGALIRHLPKQMRAVMLEEASRGGEEYRNIKYFGNMLYTNNTRGILSLQMTEVAKAIEHHFGLTADQVDKLDDLSNQNDDFAITRQLIQYVTNLIEGKR